jgi:prophage antirepressor-like protein
MNRKKEVFFMEIFNEILKLNDNIIVIVYDKNGDIWFGLRDVVKALEYNNYRKAVARLKISKKNIKLYLKIHGTPQGVPSKGTHPNKKFINESGLYELLSKSTKPLARIFMDRYFTDIMPEIRKNGKYILNKQEMNKTNEINNELKQENIELKNNLRNIIYPIGPALYLISKVVHNKKYYKLGFTKNLNKRLKVYNTGSPNKIYYNYFIMVKSKSIDSCMKNIMKNNEFIKNKEFYLARLSRILEFIKSYDLNLDKICCGYCLKCYRFNKIKMHKCKYIIY